MRVARELRRKESEAGAWIGAPRTTTRGRALHRLQEKREVRTFFLLCWEDHVNAIVNAVARLMEQTSGQDLLEYGLLVALIAIVALGAVRTLGTQIESVFWQVIVSSV